MFVCLFKNEPMLLSYIESSNRLSSFSPPTGWSVNSNMREPSCLSSCPTLCSCVMFHAKELLQFLVCSLLPYFAFLFNWEVWGSVISQGIYRNPVLLTGPWMSIQRKVLNRMVDQTRPSITVSCLTTVVFFPFVVVVLSLLTIQTEHF